MSSNISQVLTRNIDLLESKAPLFINFGAESFIQDFFAEYPAADLTCFNIEFNKYQEHQRDGKYQSYFGSHYEAEKVHDLVLINYPKVKAELALTFAMLQGKINDDTFIVLVGEKNGGIKSSPKLLKSDFEHYIKQDAARHCLIFSGKLKPLTEPFNIDDWFSDYEIILNETSLTVSSLPGVFSAKSLDIGTQELLNNLPTKYSGSVLDFGCGAGVIAAFLAKKHNDMKLTLADVNALALASAQKTLERNEIMGECLATDSLSSIKGTFDHVISNPPFHQGVKTHYAATEQFLNGIANHIKRNGTLTVVANSFLQYQALMEAKFSVVNKHHQGKGFTVYFAMR